MTSIQIFDSFGFNLKSKEKRRDLKVNNDVTLNYEQCAGEILNMFVYLLFLF